VNIVFNTVSQTGTGVYLLAVYRFAAGLITSSGILTILQVS